MALKEREPGSRQSAAWPTGCGVRVAVIDSGVQPAHPHINAAALEAGCTILRDGSVSEEPTADRLGHGTAVTAAIQESAPGAICLPVRVFREQLAASPAALIAAIRWACERKVDLLNLSLGSQSERRRSVFADAVEDANERGIAIISPRQVDGRPLFPGALPGVIGAELDRSCPRGRVTPVHTEEGLVFRTHGFPRSIAGLPDRSNFHGISFAAARIAALAARSLERSSLPDDQTRAAALMAAMERLASEASVDARFL